MSRVTVIYALSDSVGETAEMIARATASQFEESSFEMSQKQTVLEAALKQGIDAPYSCQGGICSSCLARITNGSAEMKKNSILTDGEVAEGLILTCQAHPTSAEIYVDFDDV